MFKGQMYSFKNNYLLIFFKYILDNYAIKELAKISYSRGQFDFACFVLFLK